MGSGDKITPPKLCDTMTDAPRTSSSRPEIVQWLLDTRELWYTEPGRNAQDEVQALKKVASRALNLLAKEEREVVMRFYHVHDAKMSLASHLLKRFVIFKYLHVPWSEIKITRGEHGKPCFRHPRSSKVRVSFNISHQAGIVTLIAAITDSHVVNVGTDVVCVGERRISDYTFIEKEGFSAWVGMHSYVFNSAEVISLQQSSIDLEDTEMDMRGVEMTVSGIHMLEECQHRNQILFLPVLIAGELTPIAVESNAVIDCKIRRFYAHWCMREAFVKMTGDALLAPWLKEFAIKNVIAPRAKNIALELEEGEQIFESGANLSFPDYLRAQWESEDRSIMNVKMQLVALGTDFMVAGAVEVPTALQQSDFRLGSWKILDLKEDILREAELT